MAPLFTSIFGSRTTQLDQYYKTEKIIAEQFSKTGVLMRTYQKARKGLERETQRLQEFISQNANVQIAEDTVKNRVFERRLRNRKWFTVGADALVSIPAVKLVIGETLGTGLTTPVALTVGIVFSYILLKLAIGYKNDDSSNGENEFIKFCKKYSYIIPLALIPVLSVFLIAQSPGNPANFIWLVFLGVAFLLNLKAASYSRQYQMMENTVVARKERTKMEKSIEGYNRTIEGVNDKMTSCMQKIELWAIELRKNWLDIPETERPDQINLSPKYIFVLNNIIYFTQLLPYPPLETQIPTGSVGDYHNFWVDTTGVEQSENNNEATTIENHNPEGLNAPETTENVDVTETEEEEDAPSFGTVINSNNKYV